MRKIILVFVLGLSIGGIGYWAVTSRRARDYDELVRHAGELEQSISRLTEQSIRDAQRIAELQTRVSEAAIVARRAEERAIRAEQRNAAIEGIVTDSFSGIERAIGSSATSIELTERIIGIVQELQNRIGSEDTRPP